MNRIGFTSDAEAWGRVVREIVKRRKPKIWCHLGGRESDYLKWAATWAFHWAAKGQKADA